MSTVQFIKGPTIMLRSGSYLDLQDPDAGVVTIEDIAHALSNICRYTGHCIEFYSVAQHSVLVSQIVPPQDALAGLLHDAAEAFIGDVSKPLKILLPDYQEVERRVELAVFGRFGLSPQLPASVKIADRVLLRTEQRDLMGAEGHTWQFTEGTQPLAERIVPVSPREAREAFLRRFEELAGARP
jgi:5'-deoxynucleotidase YfbR-like HD superfamily hydrolase